MPEMYVAKRRLKVGDGWREPGEPVPEAASWLTLRELIDGGYLGIVIGEGSTIGLPAMMGFKANPSDVVLSQEQYNELCTKAGIDPAVGAVPEARKPVQKPVRAEDPSNGLQGGSEAAVAVSDDSVPDPNNLTFAAAIQWAENHPGRIQELLSAEQSKPRPRKALVQQLIDMKRKESQQ